MKSEQITYMQFMEDTFGIARTFRKSGEKNTYVGLPDNGEVAV